MRHNRSASNTNWLQPRLYSTSMLTTTLVKFWSYLTNSMYCNNNIQTLSLIFATSDLMKYILFVSLFYISFLSEPQFILQVFKIIASSGILVNAPWKCDLYMYNPWSSYLLSRGFQTYQFLSHTSDYKMIWKKRIQYLEVTSPCQLVLPPII